jgi:hypothetical protein
LPVFEARHPSLMLRVTIQSAACKTRQDIARITFCIPFAEFPAQIYRNAQKESGRVIVAGVDDSPVGAWASAEVEFQPGGGAGVS